jgi:hypothetical protein
MRRSFLLEYGSGEIFHYGSQHGRFLFAEAQDVF